MNNEPFSSSNVSGRGVNSPTEAHPFSNSTPLHSATPPAPTPIAGMAPASPTSNPSAVPIDQPLSPEDYIASLVAVRSRGANWFFWIVALSVLNTVLLAFGSDKVMSIGTNATLLVDLITGELAAKYASSAMIIRAVELVLDAFILSIYGLCGVMGNKGKSWAFYVGLGIFALDTLLSLIDFQVIGILIHLWALFTMWQGLKANNQLLSLEKAAQDAPSPWMG